VSFSSCVAALERPTLLPDRSMPEVREGVMQPLIHVFPALAIGMVYCLWNVHRLTLNRREQCLRERVTYMLWVAANQIDAQPAEQD
jgi:hypothetical protein